MRAAEFVVAVKSADIVRPPVACVSCDELTAIDELVLIAIAECVVFEAVTVELVTVFRVTLNDFVPDPSAAFAGNVAAASLEVIFTVSLVLIRFQFASTELTVTLNAVPSA